MNNLIDSLTDDSEPRTKKPTKNLVINVNRPSMVELPACYVDGVSYPSLQMLPGENNVSEAQWRAAKSNPAIKIWIQCNILENKGVGKAKSLSEGLDALTQQEAETRITKCDAVPILRDWRESSSRPALQALCKERIDELIAGTN